MKYSLFALIVSIFAISSITVAQELKLETSLQQVDINQAFQLTVTVQDVDNPGAVEIVGMQVFTVYGQSTANNITMVNGVTHSQIQLQLQLQPAGTGEFVIWPARIQIASGALESNTVTIDVVGEKMFVNPQSVVDLSGISLAKNETLPQADSSILRPRYRVLLFLVLIWWTIIFFRKDNRFSKLLQQLFPTKKDNTLRPVTPKKVRSRSRLPRSNAAAFRNKLDQRTRNRLMAQGIEETDGLTAQELLQQATINSLPEEELAIFDQLIQLIQQVKYAGSEVDRREALTLAKTLLSFSSAKKY